MFRQWSFRKIGTMGTLGPKDRSSRPEGPRAEVGFLGRGSSGRKRILGVEEPIKRIAGANFVYFQSTNMRLELQNPVDYYKNVQNCSLYTR